MSKAKNAKTRVDLPLSKDPFLGYDTIEDALADYRCSTGAEVMSRLLRRENVFVSGPAGSGKTTIINKFIAHIEENTDANVALTASTGIAANLIGGRTIHSWAGLGVSTEPFDKDDISPFAWARAKEMRSADVLIIDEISMLPAYLFTKLDETLKYFRRSKKPFGGLQVILMGDFLQLPPVNRDNSIDASFAITTKSWNDLDLSYCYMDKTHRATDPRLSEILVKISHDKVDSKVREMIQTRLRVSTDSKKTYTTLFTRNKNVDKYNLEKQNENRNKLIHFHSISEGKGKDVDKLHKNNAIPHTLSLKVDDIVILTANITDHDDFYPNGSVGRIVSINKASVSVRFNDGTTYTVGRKSYYLEEEFKMTVATQEGEKQIRQKRTLASVEQVPLKLGYAITVHKSQGQTFDGVIVDLSNCFTAGLGYVALSRVRSLDDLVIFDIDDKAYAIDPKSKVISKYVKRQALEGRKVFEEKLEEYTNILVNNNTLYVFWN